MRNLSHPRRRLAVAIACAGLATGFLATSFVATGQDQSAATAKDVIFARKTLLSSIGENMAQIEKMVARGKFDLDDAHARADAISVMFMAFPHLFPPSSNQWRPNADLDPVADTFASPDLWTTFSDFYRQATDASKIAYAMSRADKIDDFKARTRELGIACEVCHALYLETP